MAFAKTYEEARSVLNNSISVELRDIRLIDWDLDSYKCRGFIYTKIFGRYKRGTPINVDYIIFKRNEGYIIQII